MLPRENLNFRNVRNAGFWQELRIFFGEPLFKPNMFPPPFPAPLKPNFFHDPPPLKSHQPPLPDQKMNGP